VSRIQLPQTRQFGVRRTERIAAAGCRMEDNQRAKQRETKVEFHFVGMEASI
jgi:hypothetical protein